MTTSPRPCLAAEIRTGYAGGICLLSIQRDVQVRMATTVTPVSTLVFGDAELLDIQVRVEQEVPV